MNAEQLARDVKLVVLDVDGVLTDGGLYYDQSGCIMKRFHVQDGLGIKMAAQAGLEFAVITGLDSPAVRRRVTELGIGHYHPGHHRKAPILRSIAEKTGISPQQMAYVGDDWVDAAPRNPQTCRLDHQGQRRTGSRARSHRFHPARPGQA